MPILCSASDDLDQLCILGVDNTQVYRVKKQDRVLLPGYNGPLEGPSSQPMYACACTYVARVKYVHP